MAGKKSAPTYYELLRHPNWQKKRLEIMERAGFECEECGGKETTLNIHHTYYEKGLKPWEYPSESLHCLCEDCHERWQTVHAELQRSIGRLGLSQMQQAIGYMAGLSLEDRPDRIVVIQSFEFASGLSDLLGIPTMSIIDATTPGKTFTRGELVAMRHESAGCS